jgi:succinoglycan biosynthesis protein ExoA
LSDVLVTVLVPAKDEARWIGACLASIAAQNYSHHLLEVIVVVDAQMTDATESEARAALAGSDYFRAEVVRHAAGGTPGNLNAGLMRAQGQVVCRVDARSRIPSHYVRTCVDVLWDRPEVAVVGGAQIAIAPSDDALGRGIARALNNRWGMGLSRYRRGARSGVSDTVYLGAFRTTDLRASGGWNTAFATNQDFELNRRLAQTGVVWFDGSLAVDYVPRPTLRALYAQYRRFGSWKARYWRLTGDRPRPRQVAMMVGVPLAALGTAAVVMFGSTHQREVAAVSALSALAFVELRGSAAPRGGPAVHAWSALALGTVGLGWLRGVWGRAIR